MSKCCLQGISDLLESSLRPRKNGVLKTRSAPGSYPGRDNAIIAVVAGKCCSATRQKDLGRRNVKENRRSFRHYKEIEH